MFLSSGFLALGGLFNNGNGTLVVIESGSITNQAALNLINLTSAYRAYFLVFDNLVPVADNSSLFMRLSDDNGSTFKSGASDYFTQFNKTVIAIFSSFGADASIIGVADNVGNVASAETVSGHAYLFNPTDSSQKTKVFSSVAYDNNINSFTSVDNYSMRNVAESNTAFRVFFSGTNIATMNYTLYGLRA